MDERLKRRLVGAVVLVVAAVVFVPMLLDQGGGAPPQPPQDTITRVVPLDSKATAPAPASAASAKPAPAEEKPSAKAVTTAAPAEPAPTGPGVRSGFAVQLGSFSKADNAGGLRDKLVAKGYTAYVKTSGSVTRVYVGPQSSRAEAEKVLKKLLTDTKLKGIVVNFSG